MWKRPFESILNNSRNLLCYYNNIKDNITSLYLWRYCTFSKVYHITVTARPKKLSLLKYPFKMLFFFCFVLLEGLFQSFTIVGRTGKYSSEIKWCHFWHQCTMHHLYPQAWTAAIVTERKRKFHFIKTEVFKRRPQIKHFFLMEKCTYVTLSTVKKLKSM